MLLSALGALWGRFWEALGAFFASPRGPGWSVLGAFGIWFFTFWLRLELVAICNSFAFIFDGSGADFGQVFG